MRILELYGNERKTTLNSPSHECDTPMQYAWGEQIRHSWWRLHIYKQYLIISPLVMRSANASAWDRQTKTGLARPNAPGVVQWDWGSLIPMPQGANECKIRCTECITVAANGTLADYPRKRRAGRLSPENAALGDYPRKMTGRLAIPEKCRVGGLCPEKSALGDYSPVNAALADYPRKLHAGRLSAENSALVDHSRKIPICAGSSQGKCPAL